MKKQTALIIFLVILFLAGGVVAYLLFFNNQETDNLFEETRENIFGSFFPTDATLDETGVSMREETQDPVQTNRPVPKLRQISNVPVAGGIIFERQATSSDFILNESGSEEQVSTTTTQVITRFIDRATGNLYETTSTNLTNTRLTNTTIPRVYSAKFSSDANSVALTYLNKGAIETLVADYIEPETLGESSTSTVEQTFGSLEGFFLPFNSFGLSISPDLNSFAFLNTTDDQDFSEKTNLFLGNFNSLNFDLEHTNYNSAWNIDWVSESIVAFNTKPSEASFGYLYFYDLNTGGFEKILGDYLGLDTLVSPSLENVLFSESGAGLSLKTYNIESGSVSFVELATIPSEKCVWSELNTDLVYCGIPTNIPNGSYPDNWNLGLVSFNDFIVKIDTSNNNQVEILLPANSETTDDLDVYNLSLSPKEDYLLFQNKNDLTLWSFDLVN